MAVTPGTGVDLLVGTGGTPEGVLAACALRCLGGEMFGRLVARDDAERTVVKDAGYDLNRPLSTRDLVAGDNVFFAATGVTDGSLLRGVRFEPHRITTHSLSMRSLSGTVRLIKDAKSERSGLILRSTSVWNRWTGAPSACRSSPTPQPGRSGRGPAPTGRRAVARRACGRWRGDRLWRGPGRCHPGPARGAGRGPRPGRRHVPSRSSKLFHGGLRYLEQLNFALVFEALKERRLALEILCPHLAEAGAVPLPAHPSWGRPGVCGAGHRRLRRDGRWSRGAEPSAAPGPAQDLGVFRRRTARWSAGRSRSTRARSTTLGTP